MNDPILLRPVTAAAHAGVAAGAVPAASTTEASTGAAGGASAEPFVTLDVAWAVIETVKRAEDGPGLVVRLFENQRNRGAVTLRAGFTVAEAFICNLLEEDQGALAVSGDGVPIDLTPYQIVSIRLIPA